MPLGDAGFPEWTELGQDSGLDPLGMQRPIEAIYQSLLPGISTITLRFRYYSFFCWIVKYYEDNIRDTDPAVFRKFYRRCEALYALVCCRGPQELGIAGYIWANKKLNEIPEGAGANAVVAFGEDAAPDADISLRYLQNSGGAFGGIYSTQMKEMGLLIIPDPKDVNPIPICSERSLPLAVAHNSTLGPLAKAFFEAVEMGMVSTSVLDALSVMKPKGLVSDSDEHRLLTDVLLGNASSSTAIDGMRRSTLLLLLELARARQKVPRAEDVKWHFYESSTQDIDAALNSDRTNVQQLWVLYQACDLIRVAYEGILSAALKLLASAPFHRMTLGGLVDELVGFIDFPADQSWNEYKQMVLPTDGQEAAKRHSDALLDAIAEGALAEQVRASVSLIVALSDKASKLTSLMDASLGGAEFFQSLKTEVRYLDSVASRNAKSVISSLILDRVLKRHLWVASRKFRNQKAYTFLMEPEEGVVRYRDHFRVAPSSPRLDQALRFLTDVMLVDDEGITALGRMQMAQS